MKKLIMAITMAMVTSFAMATSLTDGLVGYWPFDGDAKDYSGNSNHGTTHGVTLTADRNGNSRSAYLFNGEDYISVAGNIQLNAIADFTLSVWINVRYWTEDFFIPIACKGSTRQYGVEIVDEKREWVISTGYKSVFEVQELQKNTAGPDGNACIFSNKTIPTGQWIHIAVTRNGHILCAFFNGELIGSSAVSGDISKNDDDFELGRDPPGSVEYLHGSMDDVFLYNRALSSSEVLALYNGSLRVCKIAFEVNGGNGSMDMVNALSGNETALPANQFTRDGYVFLGWALAPDGEVVYRDGEEITVDSDMTLYAVWANPALTLTAESADWSSGSITLRCEDADTSGASHKYSLEYCDESGAWIAVGGASAANVSASAAGFAHLTDGGFCSRLDGIKTVSYRVKDENGRVSESCVTRNRYGLFVGVGHYSAAYQAKIKLQRGRILSDLPEIEGNTRRYSSLAQRRGGFIATNLIESDAKVQMVDEALIDLSEKVVPGDVCLFYASTHGDFDGHNAVLRLYDDDYGDSQLKRKIDLLSNKKAAVICVLAACCSEAMVRQSTANVAVIAAANYRGSTSALFDEILWDYGWENGWAGTGEPLSFGDLGDYVTNCYNSIFNEIKLKGPDGLETWDVQIDNGGLLSRIVAGTRGSHVSMLKPAKPANMIASQGQSFYKGLDVKDAVVVEWCVDSNADDYFIFFGGNGGGIYDDFVRTVEQFGNYSPRTHSCFFFTNLYECVAQSSKMSPVIFEIRAFNGAGVSASTMAEGWIFIPPIPTQEWINQHPTIATASGGDITAAAAMPAANGCRTVGECYALGIDPEDPNDDFRIANFEMKDGKPVITLNHTEDGSGNSFATRIRTLGAKELGAAAQWDDVTDLQDYGAEQGYRFFKVDVELP